MTQPAPLVAPGPARPAISPLAGWAGTLARPGSGLGLWAAAFSQGAGVAALALLLVALAALARG